MAISPASVCATMQASGAVAMTEAISASLISLKCSGRYISASSGQVDKAAPQAPAMSFSAIAPMTSAMPPSSSRQADGLANTGLSHAAP